MAMDRAPDRTVLYGPHFTEFAVLALPSDFPNKSSLRLLQHCSWGNGGPFQCLLQYSGAFYNLLLEYDESEGNSDVNKSLEKIHAGLAQKDYALMDDGVSDCFRLFLPFLKAEYHRRLERGLDTTMSDPLRNKEFTKVLFRNINGSLRTLEHSKELEYTYEFGEPVENPFPHLRIIKDTDIEISEKLGSSGFKVMIEGTEGFLKKVYDTDTESFLREFTIFAELPPHPNIVRLFGVTCTADGKVDGIVTTPFIHGTELTATTSATAEQKIEWKKQISDAVRFLHGRNVVWGDVAPHNVLIDKEKHRAVLIDFGGGISRPWIDDSLYETKEGDLQGVGRLCDYINGLDEKGVSKQD